MTFATKRNLIALCIAAYAVLVVVGAAHHEPWADEAQSWLVARDNSWMEMQWKYLRHEGSPGLWYSVLYLPAHLGLPYETSISVIAAVFAIAGVAVFLRYSPLPLWLNALVPFSFFILYQYAIVARSYCLLMVLLSLATLFLKTWSVRPLRLSFVLVLLSHVSVHGALLSLAFAAQVAVDMLDGRREYRSWAIHKGIAAVALYSLNGVGLLLLLRGPPDLGFALAPAASITEAVVTGGYYAAGAFAGHMTPPWFSMPVLVLGGLTLVWAALRGAVFGLVAAVLLAALAGARYANAWHEGALFLAWLFGLWIAWDRFRPEDRLRQGFTAVVATGIVLLHGYYGVATWRQELFETYSGARDAARYLGERHDPTRHTLWAYDFTTVAIQPYFKSPIFGNYAAADEGKGFFLWSRRNLAASLPLVPRWQQHLCDSKPDLVLSVRESRYPEKFDIEAFKICGYEIEREFPGVILFQGMRLNEMTYILMRRRDGS